jgi:hypothetical protein
MEGEDRKGLVNLGFVQVCQSQPIEARLGGSNLLSSLSMRCQRSSGKAQSVKVRALSAIGLFVLHLINQEDKADADNVIRISTHIANHNISRVFAILR